MPLRSTGLALGLALVMLSSTAAWAEPIDPDHPAVDLDDRQFDAPHIPLITGDSVRLNPDGAVEFLPGPGRQDIGFVSPSASDGSQAVMVIPSDAVEAVGNGTLDERLFNITALAQHGFLDAEQLPLVKQSATAITRLEVDVTELPRFWRDLPTAELDSSAGTKLWLDDDTGRSGAIPDEPEAFTTSQEAPGDQSISVHFSTPDGGIPAQAQVNVQHQETGKVYYLRTQGDGIATGQVPPGEYTALAFQRTDGDDAVKFISLTYHRFTVADQSVEWSVAAAELQRIEFDVPAKDASLHHAEFRMQANLAGLSTGMSFTSIQEGDWDYYSAPTGEQNLYFVIRPTLTGAADLNGDTDYSYHLVYHSATGVPDDLSFEVKNRRLAAVDSRYATRGEAVSMWRNSYGRVGTGYDSAFVIPKLAVSAPSRRIEYYTASETVEWFQQAELGDPQTPDWMVRHGGYYSPGRYTVVWGGAPLTPGLVSERYQYAIGRTADRITGITPLFSGPDSAEITWSRTGVTGVSTLSRDGEELGRNTLKPETQFFALPQADAGEYTLSVSGTRDVAWSELGIAGTTEWTFHSQPADSRQLLDLSVVAMNASGVRNGYASTQLPQLINLEVHRQGRDADTTALTFEVSYDDGQSWRKVPLLRDGSRAATLLWHPGDAEFVSVRMTAEDSNGNTVSQETIRSYGLL